MQGIVRGWTASGGGGSRCALNSVLEEGCAAGLRTAIPSELLRLPPLPLVNDVWVPITAGVIWVGTLGGVAGAICASSLLFARPKMVSEVVCASLLEGSEVIAKEGVAVCAGIGAGRIGTVLSSFVFVCVENIFES